jgi:tetratricopeptide (TPR) repeat protein
MGGVDLLADALTPFQMTVDRRRAFESQASNSRRADMIAQKFPGPFYLADCDTASFIYLAVAERLKLPLYLVVIPSFNRRPGHTFVRWREGSQYLDWETTEGREPAKGYYLERWRIAPGAIKARSALTELTRNQVLGCAHYFLAVQYERQKKYEQALEELSTALELYPQSMDARREFAWVAATAPDLRDRRHAEAIENAAFVARLSDDPDAHDTLAAAYASAGMFDLAVKAQRAALSHSERAIEFKFDYARRLQLYQQKMAYRQTDSPR